MNGYEVGVANGEEIRYPITKTLPSDWNPDTGVNIAKDYLKGLSKKVDAIKTAYQRANPGDIKNVNQLVNQ